MAQAQESFGGEALATLVADLRQLAIGALARMYRPDRGLFCFTMRAGQNGPRLEGVSARYTAIVLLALADEDAGVAREILGGKSAQDVCRGLIEHIRNTTDLGEVALTLWAARALDHPEVGEVLDQLRAMRPAEASYPTVEVAWSLTGQVVPGGSAGDAKLSERIARRLLGSFRSQTGLFPHWPAGAAPSRWRDHVACYADLVYPIQALSYYHRQSGSREALEAARRCGERMCALQGPAGQWWWHYDVRTGRVLERYPVYAVHQDAMGPMALRALAEADGGDHREATARSMWWLVEAPELSSSLVDRQAGVIWRKVARREPGKLVRRLQAAVSRPWPVLRVPAVDVLFPPGWVDWESRPYHMGWLLHAWRAGWQA